MNFSIRGGAGARARIKGGKYLGKMQAGAWARRKSRDELKGANIRGEDNDAGCLNFSIRGGAGARARRKSRDELKD